MGWLTIRQAAKNGPLSEAKIRDGIHSGEIQHAKVGGRYLLPENAVEEYLGAMLRGGPTCPEETKGQNCAGSKNEAATTSLGLTAAEAGSAARARRIGEKLKRSSPNGSTSDSETPARVIPLKS
ncbi:helix-turn-helix domain-containing protein [Roseovarius sp.]|uniref:helix-turn-helix domain-containing protein n=1 Tax=Roseovarius sp. TaxID=1486281 RepID=UPI003BA84EEE